ncbi:response regulator transcription factor [Vibrio breoganii]
MTTQFGLHIGWSKAMHATNGVSILTSFCRDSERLLKNELIAITPLMLWLTSAAEQTAERLSIPSSHQTSYLLTPREVEVLKWTAIGKTASEIAMILNLAERTVTFHITNAVRKLNTCNKTSAVIKAITLGLLY